MSRQHDEVETQPAACTAEPHAAEISRMIDDPLMLDTEAAGDLARIYETAPALRARLTIQEFASRSARACLSLPVGLTR
jgi:hypothetical protein